MLVALPASAQLLSGRLTTSVYGWEQYDTVGTSQKYFRAFQTAQLSLAHGDLSVHTFLQGTANLTSAFGDAGLVRVYNLYANWANIGKMFDLSIGRQAVYAGVGLGTIDGLVLRGKFADNMVRFTGFGGATVNPSFTGVQSNWHDNFHFGGQVLATPIPDARVGISYMKRYEERDAYWALRARDTTFSPYRVYIANDDAAEEYLSGDVAYAYNDAASFYGRYDHDLRNGRASRVQGGARVQVSNALEFTGDYIHRIPRIAYNSIFSAFMANSINEVEGGLNYRVSRLVNVFGKLASVSYSDESSMRWTLGVNTGFGSFAYSASNGYAGELQSFSVQGSYPLMQRMLIGTAGISYASYRLSAEDARNDAFSMLLGAIVRPTSSVSVDLQGQWLANKIMSSDMRVQVRFMYWFAQQLSGGTTAGTAPGTEEGKH